MTREQFEPMAKCWRLRAYQVAQAFGIADEQAGDIAQETLLKLWAMRDDLERYRSVDALVVVIAKHIAIDYSRRKPLVRLDEASAQLPIADNQADINIIDEQEQQWLLSRLSQLPSRQHQVLMLRQVEGRSYEEIAALLGIEPTSARVILSRARKWLLKQYKEREQNINSDK